MATEPELEVHETAEALADVLDREGIEYAFGGALALINWTEPRMTVDVDVTLFMDVTAPERCLDLLEKIACEFNRQAALSTLTDHGYCRCKYRGRQLDVFLPLTDFYATAKARRATARLPNREVLIWDAETLCVFKLMFFRLKDFADIESMLRTQGQSLDRQWVEREITTLFGKRDPRVARWQELCELVP
jgi:hypothetical protein